MMNNSHLKSLIVLSWNCSSNTINEFRAFIAQNTNTGIMHIQEVSIPSCSIKISLLTLPYPTLR